MANSELLVKHGFIKGNFQNLYQQHPTKKTYEKADGSIDQEHADEEIYEETTDYFAPSGFPKSSKRYQLIYEIYDLSIEETYYWILKYLSYDSGFPNVEKVEDTFAAAEGSAFFGVMQQRIGIQQDKISQFLATIGKMTKELFQLVRELRIIDERVEYYHKAEEQLKKPQEQRNKSDEITLKGMFIDLVQGGAKSAASVFGMARELEYTTLPDLFFEAPPFETSEEMESYVDKLEFNQNVLRVMKRHLRHFMEWKKRTYQELKTRRRFTLQYLRQHFDIIKMYMEWAKPYMKNVERMQTKEKRLSSPELIMAFEGSMIDIELLASKPYGDYHSCILATFNYRTRPSMKFVQEGYQRGPVHVGKMELNLRAYVWTKEQMDHYKQMKEAESFELLKTVSDSVKAAMEALGDELFKYLQEAGEEAEKKKEEAPPKKGIWEFLFGDFLIPKEAKSVSKKPKKAKPLQGNHDQAKSNTHFHIFNTYKNFKKAHGMIMW